MPAYSFQGQFVPVIENETKPHTVRANRKDGKVPKPGDRLYLYYGMRTKQCRKIGEAVCSGVKGVTISDEGIEFHGLWGGPLVKPDCDKFAWKDGFRPEGSTAETPGAAFKLLLHFFKQTHELPFKGVVIYWKDFKATPK